VDDRAAEDLVALSDIVWHQRFQLSEHVWTPGVSDIEQLIDLAGVPQRLDGLSVLDVGTSNGGAAFIAERRGAERVLAVDIYGPDWFGFDRLSEALGSKAQFLRASVYELPELVAERFDVVFFFGVLYHLRHPLLAIDQLWRLARGPVYVETAIVPGQPGIAFYPADELNGDASNWFAPSVQHLIAWFQTSGFVVDCVEQWPSDDPRRAALVASPLEGPIPYATISYEKPLRVMIDR
jgi:tRNA (mo5U34)-methyltransferase